LKFFHLLFDASGFMPHGYCYLWNAKLVSLHVVSDSVIALAYFAIPAALLWFIRKRPDLPFTPIFALFGLFIVACGMTHVMEVWNLWHADYWMAGAIKAVTAAASLGTAIATVRMLPKAARLPSISTWMQSTATLEKEIQDRRETELELRISESTYREQAELLDLTHDAIFVRDLDSRVVYWNSGAEKLYGWKKHEVRGKVTHGVLHTQFPEPVADITAQVFSTGYWAGELLHQRRDGTILTVSSRWALRTDAGGQPVAILESNRDVTERRRIEVQVQNLNTNLRRKVEELTAANRELESFSYSVSHDLRAPLRHIDGFARILRDEHAAQIDEDGIRYLDRVLQSANHMGRLVDDLINLARIGRGAVNQQIAKLDRIVRDAMAELPEETGDRKIEWRIEPLPERQCDPGLLKLVFVNLLSNAIKFTRDRPAAVIEVGTREIEGVTAIFVRDNGVGFDPRYADKLFGVFQRLHKQEDFEGTGIGLATVQRIIRRHGGEVWTESELGRGATFLFTLGVRPPSSVLSHLKEVPVGRV
jgi:PAS domain S-box-containing protein